MRKILNIVVLFSFISQQLAWAAPLPWNPDFESASVLPYHVDAYGRSWVLLSKKNYNDPDYGAHSWGDFGGKVEDGESAITAAERELAEETAGQITASQEELMAGPYHQFDMKNSPFGDNGVRRHTIFFKKMPEMFSLKIEEGADRGPSSDGSHEVSQYQWVLAKDLLEMTIPGIFGRVLGLYTPDALRVDPNYRDNKNECFSVPFFVLLQQAAVKRFLLKEEGSQTFSQIAFSKLGFQDWRLVHSGLLSEPVNELEARLRQQQLEQTLHFDPESISEEVELLSTERSTGQKWTKNNGKWEPTEKETENNQDATDSPVQIRLFHGHTNNLYYHQLPDSPNSWHEETENEDVHKLMNQYTLRSRMLKEMKLQSIAVAKSNNTSNEFSNFQIMTDSQLRYLFEDSPVDLTDTAAVLEAYKTKVKSMHSYTTAIDTITHPSFVAAVDAVLKEERAHPEMFTAYHGCTAEIHFLNTVYSALSEALGLPKRAVHWRLFDSVARHYANVSSAFSDTAQSGIQASKFVNYYEVLVAANAALTGNPEHDGCRTLTYWKRGYSETPLDLKHVLGDVLTGIGIKSDQTASLVRSLYALYESLYFVEDPESSTVVDSSGSSTAITVDASSSAAETPKRRVGILRQIFVTPESVEEQLALSGWFFNHPLAFDDRQLPDGSIISIYANLEEGSDAWMRALPNALRFMAHIRAGHSADMERNIKAYHAQVPDGLRPFGLLGHEVRLFAGQDPTLVKTHFYPTSEKDSTREEEAKIASSAIIRNALPGTELPIRSFHDFYTTYQLLQQIIKNQLGIRVAHAPVSLEQFKAAVAQGDRETMEVYLQDSSVHTLLFEETDIITGQIRKFTLPDYMAMVAMRHNMAANTIGAAAKKHNLISEQNIDFTQTPYALWAILQEGGLNLQQLGWDGSLATALRFAHVDSNNDDPMLSTGVAKESHFSGTFLELTIADLMHRPLTLDMTNFIRAIGRETNFSMLPSYFWENLVAMNAVSDFIKSGFVGDLNEAKWNAIIAGLDAAGIDEQKFYTEQHDAILEMFKRKEIVESVNQLPFTHIYMTSFSKNVLKNILEGLVRNNGRDEVLEKLKAFGNYISISTGKDDGSLPRKSIYDIFKEVGLVDHSWKDFFNYIADACFCSSPAEQRIDDIIEIVKDGYPDFSEFQIGNILVQLPFVKFQSCISEPALADLILKANHYINLDNSVLLPAEKKAIRFQLYDLAYQNGKLDNLSISSDIGEWLMTLPDSERLAVLNPDSFSIKTLKKFNLPSIYQSDAAIQELAAHLFPTEKHVIEFLARGQNSFFLKDTDQYVLDRPSIDWLYRLLQPRMPEVLSTMLKILDTTSASWTGSSSIPMLSPLAAVLYAKMGIQLPDKKRDTFIHPHSFVLARALTITESSLVLSADQFIYCIKNSDCNKLHLSFDPSTDISDVLTARFAAIKETVREGLFGDINSINKLQKMTIYNMGPNDTTVREFLQYIRGNWYLNEAPEVIAAVRSHFFAGANKDEIVERVLSLKPDEKELLWIAKVVGPHIPAIFREINKNLQKITPFALALFATVEKKLNEDLQKKAPSVPMKFDIKVKIPSIRSNDYLVEKLGIDVLLALSPEEIVPFLKGPFLRSHRWSDKDDLKAFDSRLCDKCYSTDSLAARLETAKDAVKVCLARDAATTEKLRTISNSFWMKEPMKSFLAFVSAD